MESSNHLKWEFLDLTDVDEYEKNRVISSLQSAADEKDRFPWFIGNNKSSESSSNHVNNVIKTTTNNNNNNTVATKTVNINTNIPIHNSVNNGPSNSQYYAPISQYYVSSSVPVQLSPNNYGIYPQNNEHAGTTTTVYSSYFPNYPTKAPIFYTVPQPVFLDPTQTQIYYPPVNNEPPLPPPLINNENATTSLSADTPEFTPKELIQSTSISSSEPSVVLIEEDPAAEIIQQETYNNSILEVTETNNNIENIEEEEEKQPKQTNSVNGKSWASLFASKQNNSAAVNGLVKPSVYNNIQAKNKESNNVDECPIKNPKRNDFVDPDCYRMGEFLQNYIVDAKTISIQPRGLINQSNYCYINSILQALLACPPMYNLLSGLAENITSNEKRKPTPVIDGMCKFVKEYKHLPANMRFNHRRSEGGGKNKDQKRDTSLINTDIPFEPSWIYKILNGVQSDLMEGRQEDAEEFLGLLLNKLGDEMLELMKLIKPSTVNTTIKNKEPEDEDESWQVMGNKNKGSVLRKTLFDRTPITDIFGGSLKSIINRSGGITTENTQPFLTLPLNIEKVKTVKEALEALTTKNQLEGLTSSKTNEEVKAWQQVMLDELPIVLILHLKCFDFKMDGCTKIVKQLEFPIDLKIDGKLFSLKTTNAKEKQYKLFAVVYHDGKDATKGHYITDAFHVGYSNWLRYDDASVKPVQQECVLNPEGNRVPYLLFYRRSDTIRSR